MMSPTQNKQKLNSRTQINENSNVLSESSNLLCIFVGISAAIAVLPPSRSPSPSPAFPFIIFIADPFSL
jgi:hypothetical protein